MGLIPPVNRRESGLRDYNEDDIKWIEFIICMRNAGLTIEALFEYTTLFIEGITTLQARRNILVDERERLIDKRIEIDEIMKRLGGKIEDYDGKLLEKETELKRRAKMVNIHE